MKNKLLKSAIAVGLIMLLTCGASALVYNSVPAIKMHLSGTTLEESVVEVTDITPVGNKKVNSVIVGLDNTDVDNHMVNVYVSLCDASNTEIGSGTLIGETVTPGTTSITVALDVKPDMADVIIIDVVVREVA